jgi:hypothetical protein
MQCTCLPRRATEWPAPSGSEDVSVRHQCWSVTAPAAREAGGQISGMRVKRAAPGPAFLITAGITLLLLAAPPLSGMPLEGSWSATEQSGNRVHLTLRWNSTSWGRSIDREELRGLTGVQIEAAAATGVSFRIEREAGVFEMEGVFRDGRGAGDFRFQEDARFASSLAGLGIEGADQLTERDLAALALADVSTETIGALGSLGFNRLTHRQLLALAIHDVTPEYVRALRSVGVSGLDGVPAVVEMRIHGVTPGYVRELAGLGYAELSARELVSMRIHRVTPKIVRELAELGYRDLPAKQLVELQIHRVTPELIGEYHALGYSDLTSGQLVDMRIHRVMPQYIRDLREAGVRDDMPPEALVRMRIHRLDRAFLQNP